MKRRILLLLALTFILVNVFVIVPRVQKAEAWTGTAYIRANGDVDPFDAPIQRNGDIYTLTGNITTNGDGIVIERNNMILDGAGYALQGAGVISWYGIDLTGRTNVTVQNTNIKNFGFGVFLSGSSYNSIYENNITANIFWGIALDRNYSYNNTISGNNIISNVYGGISIYQGSSYNTISRNNITANNQVGINFFESNNNTISGNSITNSDQGIHLSESYNNTFCHNNLIDNAHHIFDWSWDNPPTSPSINSWDDGLEGNYWSNYTGADLEPDGIGNSPHILYANNKDNYPLMGMFSDFAATPEYHVQTVCNSTISDFKFGGSTIRFDVSGEDGIAGFCRICIPIALLGNYRVFVNDVEVPYLFLSCSNSTHSYLYFTYTHSTKQVVIEIPEFPAFILMPLFMTATLLAVIVHMGRRSKKLS